MVKSLFNLTYYFFIGLCLSLSFPLLAFSSLQSQVDKNPALAGEAITLTVTADARLAADALNYRQLEQHFRVMVPSVSQSTQVINGVSTQSTRWSFTLFPLASGTFTIPAFEINGLSSDPITLTVLAQSASNEQVRELFVEATLQGSSEIYVQQMLYYDVVIYFSGDLQRGNLTEPQLEGAEIQRIGQDVEGSDLVNGVRYRTITRRYSITPQRSGSQTIAPPLFTGDIIERDTNRYNYFARSKTVMQEAQPITIEVKPQPIDFNGSWLVAGLVTLTEEWQPAQSELTVGEPVTRIITLSAVDVASSQLPELNQQLPAQVRFYQEQAQAKGAERNGRLVAQKIFTTAIIANEAGDLILPEVRLPWWNSQTQRQEVAVLPERAFKVMAASGTVSSLAPVPTFTPAPSINPWQWNYTSSLLLIGWLLSLLVFGYMKKPQRQRKIAAEATTRRPFADKLLKQACASADAQQAATQILLWGQTQFSSSVRSLEQLAKLVEDPVLAAELTLLAQQLYSPRALSWQGTALYQAWRNWRPAKTTANTAALAPLYPR